MYGLLCSRVRLLIMAVVLVVFIKPLLAQPKPFANSFFINIEGMDLHYRTWGSNIDNPEGFVLLVHGFAGSTFSWQEIAKRLESYNYFVVAVDVPPFGFSDRSPRQNQSVTARAMLLNSFLKKEFPEKKWHIVGHSMGGGIVQAMALMYPERFQSVAFVAATLFSSVKPGRRNAPFWSKIPGVTFFMGEIAENWFITGNRIENLLQSAYGILPSPQQVQGYLQPLIQPGTARAILNSARFSFEYHSLDALHLSIPSIAIWGDHDTWVPLESRKKIIEMIPGVQLYIIPDCGHNPMETHPDEFLALWLTFINNL
jgi:2-hydroxy-6-oxonona-2,4-dienedioate hydrolase